MLKYTTYNIVEYIFFWDVATDITENYNTF